MALAWPWPTACKSPVRKARRRSLSSRVDCVRSAWIGSSCWINANGVLSFCPTKAPSVTRARPIRPEIGAVTVAYPRFSFARSTAALLAATSAAVWRTLARALS
ncbi:hypothetical protein D3C76_1389280 [compost metagenome]